ncbi:MAG: hypothetical protein V4577_16590 [Bacteroidota bacterium]
MTADELDEIKLKGRWPIKFSDFYNHYFFALFPLMFVLIGASMLYSGNINSLSDLKILGWGFIIGGSLLFIVIIKKLIQNQTFENYQIENLTADKIRAALKPLKFANIYYHKAGYFVLTMRVSLFSWGEEVTLIFEDSEIFINSRPRQPVTFGRDRKNIRTIVAALQAAE